jgi:hypothetical protein
MRIERSEILRMRAGIRAWVLKGSSGPGRSLRETAPPMLLSLLCAAAFCPLVVPVAGVVGVVGAGVGVLSTVGGGVLAEIILSAIERLRPAGDPDKPETADQESEIARRIQRALEAGDANSQALRAEISAVLREIDAQETLLRAGIEAGEERIRHDVAAVIEVIGAGFSELGFGIAEIDRKAAEIQKSLDVLAAERRADSYRFAHHGTQIRLLREDFAAFAERYPVGGVSVAGNGPLPRWEHGAPYRGLVPFGEEDAAVFYGRTALTADLARQVSGHLNRGGLVVVTGASGAGKSSLLRAGLVPALAGGRQIEGSAELPRIVMKPTKDPVAELARRLAALSGAGTDAFAIRQHLAKYPEQAQELVWDALHSYSARNSESKHYATDSGFRLVLIVDQFEEVFTLGANPGDESRRRAFITALCAAAARPAGQGVHPAALVIIAVRGDFWGQCEAYPELASELENGRFAVLPMTETSLRLAITGPADAAGLRIDAGLTDTILADLRTVSGDAPIGALPLLSQAMLLTWQNREGDWLTNRGYDMTGGVGQAVQASADDVYDSLPAERQILAQQMLRSMTIVGRNGKLTSREVTRADLCQGKDQAQADAVLGAFADKRLIVLDGGRVRVAHEALIEGWERLREWAEPDLEFQRWLSQTQAQVGAWESLGRDEDSLLRGKAQKRAASWVCEKAGEIDQGTKEFIILSDIRDGLIRDLPGDTALEISREFNDSRFLTQVLDAVIGNYLANGKPILAAAYWKERWSLVESSQLTRAARLKRAASLLLDYAAMSDGLWEYCISASVAWLVVVGLVIWQFIGGQYGLLAAVASMSVAVIALFWYRAGPLLHAAWSMRDEDRTLRFKQHGQVFDAVCYLPFAIAGAAVMASCLRSGPIFGALWTAAAATGLCAELVMLFIWARTEREASLAIDDEPSLLDRDEGHPAPDMARSTGSRSRSGHYSQKSRSPSPREEAQPRAKRANRR